MKAFHIIFAFLLCCTASLQAQQVGTTTVVKSVALGEQKVLILDFLGEVEFVEWDAEVARVQTEVSVQDIDDNTVKRLAMASRYKIESKETAEGLLLSMSNLHKPVIMRGQELQETCRFVVEVPKGIEVRIRAQKESATL